MDAVAAFQEARLGALEGAAQSRDILCPMQADTNNLKIAGSKKWKSCSACHAFDVPTAREFRGVLALEQWPWKMEVQGMGKSCHWAGHGRWKRALRLSRAKMATDSLHACALTSLIVLCSSNSMFALCSLNWLFKFSVCSFSLLFARCSSRLLFAFQLCSLLCTDLDVAL